MVPEGHCRNTAVVPKCKTGKLPYINFLRAHFFTILLPQKSPIPNSFEEFCIKYKFHFLTALYNPAE